MRKIILLIIAIAFTQQAVMAQNPFINVIVYKRDTSFQCIAVDTTTNNVYAGTIGKGLVKYDQKVWRNWNGENVPGIGIAFKKGNLNQIGIYGGTLWVASSGFLSNFSGNPNDGYNYHTLGSIYRLNAKIEIKRNKYLGQPMFDQCAVTCRQGPPTRNLLGSYIASDGTPWCVAEYQDSMVYATEIDEYGNPSLVPIYRYVPGAVGRFNGTNYDFITGVDLPKTTYPFLLIGGAGNRGKTESYSIGKRRSCRSITQVGNEMWVGSDGYDQALGNLKTACILRYNLAGTYLGKIDQVNTPAVNFGLTNTSKGPWAMVEDTIGRVWITMDQTRGIAVKDTNGIWVNIGIPSIMPTGTVFRANSIATNKINKEVYFGTNNGLLVYKGEGSFTDNTSYRVYNTSNGLSSNFINGITIAKDQTIWLATVAGINKITVGDLNIYTLKSSSLTNPPPPTDNDNFRRLIATYDSRKTQTEIDKDTLFIAADGSKATILKWVGSNPKNVKFRIKNQVDGDEFGSFQVRYLIPTLNDSITVQYTHPTFIDEYYTISGATGGDRNLRLQVVDTVASQEIILLEFPVKIVLPPVLMIHGLWSDGKTWDDLKNNLLTNGLYKYKPYEILTPSYESDREFNYNRTFIPSYVDDLIENCSKNRMSVGKVDVVGHSMGGILSRLYLQSGAPAPAYQKNIHKLITINTPHSGSPLANIVENKDDFLKWILKVSGKDPYKGALNNLKIGNSPIDSILNGTAVLNKNIVPSHVINTADQVPAWAEFADGQINNFIKSPITLKPEFYTNIVGGASNAPNPWVIGAKLFLFSVKYYLTSNTSCQWNTPPNACLQNIFGGTSDLIVSTPSQIGGIQSAKTFFNGLNHLNVLKSPLVHVKVLEVLRAKDNSPLLTTDGFMPAKYIWNPILGSQPARASETDSIKIISPAYGATFNRGDSVTITVRATSSINRVLFGMAYEDNIDGFGIETPDSTFKFKIPNDATSRINYKVFGFSTGANVFNDSSYINIGVNPSLILDSIKITHPRINDLKVTLNDSTAISIMGYYNDGVRRNITYQTGLTYSTLFGSVSTSAQGYVKGLILGFDELKATYLGKTDSTYIEVIAKPIFDTVSVGVLPVRFLQVTAKYNGENINVNWATASELNNHHFEIEYSKNGTDFIKAGTVNATNNSNGDKYDFIHKDFVTGKNYYRIKQVDINGIFSYSNIVVSIISEKNNVRLYPNPVTETLVVDISKASNNFKKGIIIITNSIGQTIQQQIININGNKTFINTAELAVGIYNIQIVAENKEQLWADRFIKNK